MLLQKRLEARLGFQLDRLQSRCLDSADLKMWELIILISRGLAATRRKILPTCLLDRRQSILFHAHTIHCPKLQLIVSGNSCVTWQLLLLKVHQENSPRKSQGNITLSPNVSIDIPSCVNRIVLHYHLYDTVGNSTNALAPTYLLHFNLAHFSTVRNMCPATRIRP